MATNERSVETTASPQAAWKIWSDASTWPEWNPDVQSMTLTGPFAAGTTGTMKTKQGTRAIQLTEVVAGKSRFRERGNVRNDLRALGRRYAEGDEFAVLQVSDHRVQRRNDFPQTARPVNVVNGS